MTDIFILLFILFPFQSALCLSALEIRAFKIISNTRLPSFAVECILMKSAFICKLGIHILASLIFCLIIYQSSLVIWSIREDKYRRPLWFALYPVRNYKWTIFLIDFAISIRSILLTLQYNILYRLALHINHLPTVW